MTPLYIAAHLKTLVGDDVIQFAKVLKIRLSNGPVARVTGGGENGNHATYVK